MVPPSSNIARSISSERHSRRATLNLDDRPNGVPLVGVEVTGSVLRLPRHCVAHRLVLQCRHMNSAALTIRTDPKTKKVIADFAASVGLSTSAFATAILLQAVREQRVLLTPTLEPTPYLKEVMRKAKADRTANRNYTTVKNEAELDVLFKSL